ncbi:hypothetical protein EJB05_29336 [Eragrostis curvula]|uniref:AIPP2-like SPOC-like domain-containing protein n=1 Tax=Eragrostis curvula TaxID=38414 RepID=A0A5J9UTA7_9POAL|nr:hypothetical protein EJB05_29336 [Eragrostis curvula]
MVATCRSHPARFIGLQPSTGAGSLLAFPFLILPQFLPFEAQGGEGREAPVASLAVLRPCFLGRRSFCRCRAMDVVCEVCGAVGFKHLLVQCSNCKNSTRHRYCMDTIDYDGVIEWLCDDCLPKHNQLMESLEVFPNQRQLNHIHLDSSEINESDVDRVEVTMELPLWGHRRNRSSKAKRDSSKHFQNGGTFDSSKKFAEHHNVDKVVESENDHLICSLERVDGPNHSSSNPTLEIKEDINVHKTMVGSQPSMNSMEGLDLPKGKDSCFLPKHAEESISQGTKAGLFPSNNDIERCHPFASVGSGPVSPSVEQTDGSNLMLEPSVGQTSGSNLMLEPSVEQTDGSNVMLESVEQPHPLEVVKPDGSGHSALGLALESEVIGLENSMGGLGSTLNSVEWMDHPKEKDDSTSKNVAASIPQETMNGLYPSIYDVERSRPSFTDGCSPSIPSEENVGDSNLTLESWKQPHPLQVIYPLVYMPKSIQGSKSSPHHLQLAQGLDQNIQNDPLNPSKELSDSRSMSKDIGPSCSSNGQEDSSNVEKDGPNGRIFLLDNITPAPDNLTDSSLSMAKDCLLFNADNSDEGNISDKRGQSVVMSHQTISSGEVHCSGSCLNERSESWKVNKSSSPKSASTGNQQGSNLQNDVQKTSIHADKNVVCRQVSQMEGINSEELPSETSSPCKATESSSKKRHNRPNRHSRHLARNRKSKIINADPAQLKSGRSSKQLDITHPSASLELSSKSKEVRDASGTKARCSNARQTFENVVPKKRKGLAAPYNKDEDAEAMQTEDLDQSRQNDGQVKKNRTHAENGVMNPLISVENRAEALHPGTLNDHVVAKKQKGLVLPYNKDEDAEAMKATDLNQSCDNDGQVTNNRPHAENGVMDLTRPVENRAEVLSPRILDDQYVDNHTQAKKKSIEANDDGNALLVDPNGGFAQKDNAKLTSQDAGRSGAQYSIKDASHFSTYRPTEYISLAAHLSNQACKKVQELSRSLPPVMKVTNHPKLKAWPSRWEELEPTAEDIGLYFFSDNMRPNKDLDRLVQYVTDHSIVMKYVFGFVKLLIFPSVFLPEQSQMFQGKHYLWGVFKRRKATSKGDPLVRKQDRTPQAAKKRKDRQHKVQGDTLDQEKPVSKHIIPNDNQPSPGTVNGVGIETIPCDDEEVRSSSEAPAPEVLVVIDLQAPRSEHYIRELKREGAQLVTGNGLAKAGPVRL